jgi:hypothetical protein
MQFVLFLPLTFVSASFVATRRLPDGLRDVADWNPVSAVTAATRELFGNPNPRTSSWPMTHPVLASLGWSLLLLAVCVPVALRGLRRRTTE